MSDSIENEEPKRGLVKWLTPILVVIIVITAGV